MPSRRISCTSPLSVRPLVTHQPNTFLQPNTPNPSMLSLVVHLHHTLIKRTILSQIAREEALSTKTVDRCTTDSTHIEGLIDNRYGNPTLSGGRQLTKVFHNPHTLGRMHPVRPPPLILRQVTTKVHRDPEQIVIRVFTVLMDTLHRIATVHHQHHVVVRLRLRLRHHHQQLLDKAIMFMEERGALHHLRQVHQA
jgi:hypothetical protein